MQVTNFSSRVVDGLNEIGTRISKGASKARGFVVEKTDSFVKSSVVQEVKKKANKETYIGLAAVVAAIVLAIKCIKGVVSKVSEVKK